MTMFVIYHRDDITGRVSIYGPYDQREDAFSDAQALNKKIHCLTGDKLIILPLGTPREAREGKTPVG